MTKTWVTLGLIFVLIAIAIYLDQWLRLEAHWKWDDFFHHECWIGMVGFAAIMLFIVAIIERIKGIGRI